MKAIQYVIGDATKPIGKGLKLIIHCCNDLVPGAWGSGFVLAISKRWTKPEIAYRRWSIGKGKDCPPYSLGQVVFVPVEDDIVVVNMIGQHNTIHAGGDVPPIRYEAVDSCLQKVAEYAIKNNASVHGPRFGCGLAAGTWEEIEKLITKNLSAKDIEVIIYDLKK